LSKPASPPRLNLILTLLVLAQFVIVLDFSIVQIALPTMRTELGISLADSQWIVSAYGLTFAGFLLLSGRASDLYGRRRLFGIGLVVFALSSLAGGLAPSESVLIGARAVQGIGAAIASATGLSLLVVTFAEGRERNRALSIFAAVSSAAQRPHQPGVDRGEGRFAGAVGHAALEQPLHLGRREVGVEHESGRRAYEGALAVALHLLAD